MRLIQGACITTDKRHMSLVVVILAELGCHKQKHLLYKVCMSMICEFHKRRTKSDGDVAAQDIWFSQRYVQENKFIVCKSKIR